MPVAIKYRELVMDRVKWTMTRAILVMVGLGMIVFKAAGKPPEPVSKRPLIEIRGVYGGVPQQIFDRGETLDDYGINAIWIGSGSVSTRACRGPQSPLENAEGLRRVQHDARCRLPEGSSRRPADRSRRSRSHRRPTAGRVFARPIPAIAAIGWRPFAKCLKSHRSTASGSTIIMRMRAGNRPSPTCRIPVSAIAVFRSFNNRRRSRLPEEPALDAGQTDPRIAQASLGAVALRRLHRLGPRIPRNHRPGTSRSPAGNFPLSLVANPTSMALCVQKLAIDLKAQAKYLDVFSIMPYHARFGHAADPAWISRQTAALGRFLGIKGEPGERLKIWPIVQLSDWGETVPVSQVKEVLDHGTRAPATGVMVFVWGSLHPQWDKVQAMREFYRAIRPDA